MTLNGVALLQINDRAVESADQDQTARMCGLIFLYTLCKQTHVCEWQDTGKYQ